MDELTRIFEQRYIDGLTEKTDGWRRDGKRADPQDIAEIFRWLKEHDITDDRSIRGLFRLFTERDCLTLAQLPADFRAILSREGEAGVYRAETLLLKELGTVPL